MRKGGVGMTLPQRSVGDDIQEQSDDDVDETQDPSDVCDFGYDVVSSSNAQSDRPATGTKRPQPLSAGPERQNDVQVAHSIRR